MAVEASDPYRIDWWLPLTCSPGEWAGRWDLAAGPVEARAVAIAALGENPAKGFVLVTLLQRGYSDPSKVVADAGCLDRWSPWDDPLPPSGIDLGELPPLGREDVEHVTLVRCREALLDAHDAELLDKAVVAAIVEIVQQAFTGVGPAMEIADAIGVDVNRPGRS